MGLLGEFYHDMTTDYRAIIASLPAHSPLRQMDGEMADEYERLATKKGKRVSDDHMTGGDKRARTVV